MDSCVYPPPDILKAQIYSFTILPNQRPISVIFLYVFSISVCERFHPNFVFGQLHITSAMCDFKETVFHKECIRDKIFLSLKCFKCMHDISAKRNDHIAFMNHTHWYFGDLWKFVVKKIKIHFKYTPVLSKTILKSWEGNSWKTFYRLSLQKLIHCPAYKRLFIATTWNLNL